MSGYRLNQRGARGPSNLVPLNQNSSGSTSSPALLTMPDSAIVAPHAMSRSHPRFFRANYIDFALGDNQPPFGLLNDQDNNESDPDTHLPPNNQNNNDVDPEIPLLSTVVPLQPQNNLIDDDVRQLLRENGMTNDEIDRLFGNPPNVHPVADIVENNVNTETVHYLSTANANTGRNYVRLAMDYFAGEPGELNGYEGDFFRVNNWNERTEITQCTKVARNPNDNNKWYITDISGQLPTIFLELSPDFTPSG